MSLDVDLICDKCKHCEQGGVVYSCNITHNLGAMAAAAGVYAHLWRPDEIGITKAGELTEPLMKGLKSLSADPGKFIAMNPTNGWGTYDGLTNFVGEYMLACIKYPNARIQVSR